MTSRRGLTPAVANYLGYAGLIPFIASLALCYVGDATTQHLGVRALSTYAAVVLSFIGGLHWGIAALSRSEETAGWYIGSAIPSLIGWVALLLRPTLTMSILLLCFTAWYLYERITPIGRRFPDWFNRLRLHLTSGAVVALVLGWLKTISMPG